jgi:hypothetical protein
MSKKTGATARFEPRRKALVGTPGVMVRRFFVIVVSSFIRHSDFGFRHFVLPAQPSFIDGIRSRKRPNSGVEQAHLSACLLHLGNVAYRTGRQRLVFDAKAERFDDNDAANRLLRPAYRKEYRVSDEV